MMKAVKAILMSLSLLLTFTSCVGNSSERTEDNDQNQTAASTEKQENPDRKSDLTESAGARLLYMGHASIRIITREEKVIYIDPFVGDGYEPAADLILITHGHYDHNAVKKVSNRNPDCKTVTWKESLAKGKYRTFDFGFATVEAVEAGYNRQHSVKNCVGYVITLSDGVSVYVSGDTSRTKQMPGLSAKHIDYAFYCCDGVYNMDIEEAAVCAGLVGAKHDIPYHVIAENGVYFDRARAEKFDSPNLLIVDEGEEIELMKTGS